MDAPHARSRLASGVIPSAAGSEDGWLPRQSPSGDVCGARGEQRSRLPKRRSLAVRRCCCIYGERSGLASAGRTSSCTTAPQRRAGDSACAAGRRADSNADVPAMGLAGHGTRGCSSRSSNSLSQ